MLFGCAVCPSEVSNLHEVAPNCLMFLFGSELNDFASRVKSRGHCEVVNFRSQVILLWDLEEFDEFHGNQRANGQATVEDQKIEKLGLKGLQEDFPNFFLGISLSQNGWTRDFI